MRERLAAVLETSGELERSRSRLIRQLRTTMVSIKALRERLRHENGADGNHGPSPAARLADRYRLTPRELEVAILLSGGASNAMIASTLGISQHTARHHTRHILVKLGLHSRARAGAVIAHELGGAALLP
jgi:DNA-binding NarL/FixJ family response regulator